ncbi:MAG: TRAP transporter small permease [Armatimonadetes bacterium]|nr:TRAP transporter small permease [Armatimonadota bacterium]
MTAIAITVINKPGFAFLYANVCCLTEHSHKRGLLLIIKVIEKITYIMAVIAGILTFLAGIYIFLSAIMRYFFNLPSGLVIDITGYILFYSTFLAAPWLLKLDKHVSVEILISSLSGKKRNFIEILNNFICAVVCVFLCLSGTIVAYDQFVRGVKLLDLLEPPKYIFTLVIPLSAFLLLIFFLKRIIQALDAMKNKGLND